MKQIRENLNKISRGGRIGETKFKIFFKIIKIHERQQPYSEMIFALGRG